MVLARIVHKMNVYIATKAKYGNVSLSPHHMVGEFRRIIAFAILRAHDSAFLSSLCGNISVQWLTTHCWVGFLLRLESSAKSRTNYIVGITLKGPLCG